MSINSEYLAKIFIRVFLAIKLAIEGWWDGWTFVFIRMAKFVNKAL